MWKQEKEIPCLNIYRHSYRTRKIPTDYAHASAHTMYPPRKTSASGWRAARSDIFQGRRQQPPIRIISIGNIRITHFRHRVNYWFGPRLAWALAPSERWLSWGGGALVGFWQFYKKRSRGRGDAADPLKSDTNKGKNWTKSRKKIAYKFLHELLSCSLVLLERIQRIFHSSFFGVKYSFKMGGKHNSQNFITTNF